ncbi:MAG: hypothetical protein R3264_06500 [Anaerolineae bacterium]|nr:hypothetical protein [Anaerolineae bacterium]
MITEREAIERVVITGRLEDRQKAREYCTAEGYRIVHDTPRIISPVAVDPNSFKIIGEKPRAV